MKSILINNQKGGVGKTSLAIELSYLFAKKGYRTLLIDFDPQGDSTTYSTSDKVEITKTIYDLIKSVEENTLTESEIENSIIHTEEGFDLIPSNSNLSLLNQGNTEHMVLFAELIDSDTIQKYDYIFIDSNPAKGILLYNAYIAADYLLIPSMADQASMDKIQSVLNDVKILKSQEIEGEALSKIKIAGIVLSRYELRVTQQAYAKQFLKMFAEMTDSIFFTPIRKSVAVDAAKTMHVAVNESDERATAAKDYVTLADELLERIKALEVKSHE